MIVLFTDFGVTDPYVGQLHAVLRRDSDIPVVDLCHHASAFDVRAGAYLLDALQKRFQPGDVFVCVVDPGVGGDRAPVMLHADGKWFLGPDNGLLGIVKRRASESEAFRIDWRPGNLSRSFHGRDLFAPAAARLAAGSNVDRSSWRLGVDPSWPDDLPEVIYIDHFGNAVTGYRAESIPDNAIVTVAGQRLPYRATFSRGDPGAPFWYRNSMDLVEISVRQASAADILQLRVGDAIGVVDYNRLLDEDPSG